MKVERTKLNDVLLLTPTRFQDDRGFFSQCWSKDDLAEADVDLPDFVQDNHSLSHQAGTLRGMHYQSPPHAQGKLVRCGRGRVWDAMVDMRKNSSTFGEWFGVELSFDNGQQVWVPPGFLHGFVSLEPDSELVYKCTAGYDRASDGSVRWDSLGIDWPVTDPILSEKDKTAPLAKDWQSPF